MLFIISVRLCPVYRVLQLGPDVVQTVDNRTALLLRKMEGFIDSV